MDKLWSFCESGIHRAARKGEIKTVATYLEEGSSVDKVNSDGQTPLILAVKNNHFILACLLLDHLADASVQDRYGRTALCYAVYNQNPLLVKYILHYQQFTSKKCTELMSSTDNAEITRYLQAEIDENSR